MSLPAPPPEPESVRFGDFRLDLASGELCNNGHKTLLQDKPLKVLLALLERPGEIVPRDELKKRLWDSDTFVDFDLSLNKAVNRLREALDDSADDPHFVETLPRRGYRFIGVLHNGHLNHSTASPTLTVQPPDIRATPLSEAPSSVSSSPPDRRRNPRRTVVFAVLVLLFCLACGALVRWTSSPHVPLLAHMEQITNDGRIKHGPLIANGGLLYYNRRAGETWEIAQVSTTGQSSVSVIGSYGFCLADIAPNGSELLAGRCFKPETPLYGLPLPGGAPRQISDISAFEAASSPDGKSIAYYSGQSLFIATRDGEERRKVATPPGPVSPIRWSPDGKKLRFTVSDMKADRTSLWETDLKGNYLRQLFPELSPGPGEAGVCCGIWTADGKYFVFQSDRYGSDNLWAIREFNSWLLTPSHPVRITSGPMRIVAAASSSDAKKMYVIGLTQRGELRRFEAKRFVPFLPGLSAVQLNFSRDGEWVTYISFPDRTLWRSRKDGSERLQLTSAPMVALWPQWSPDGRAIAFSGQIRGEPFHIYSVPGDGGKPRQLTFGSRNELHASWSADGAALIYGTDPDLEGNTGGIHWLNLRTQADTLISASSPKLRFPQLSPDGAFLSALNESRLMLYSFKNRKWVDLGVSSADQPHWSADSMYIYFTSESPTTPAAYRIRATDHKVDLVATLSGLRRPSYGNFTWVGAAPDGSIIAFNDMSSSEIYSFNWDLQ